MHIRLQVGRLWSFSNRHVSRPYLLLPPLLRCKELGDLLHFFRYIMCEGEVIIQGDESRKLLIVMESSSVIRKGQQEEEGDGEELKERCTWMACGWSEWQVRAAWAMWCDEWIKRRHKKKGASVLNSACCACTRASCHSCYCPLWSHRCWRCACRCTHFYVAIS